MERRVPGDLGWRLEDGSQSSSPGDPTPQPGGLLRVLSVIPFVVLGAVAVIALVGWLLIFVLGVGEQESLWAWASGLSGGEILRGLAVVLGLGLGCLVALVLAMWATLYGFRLDASRLFWTAWQVAAAAALVALIVTEAVASSRDAVGLRPFDVLFLAVALVAAFVVFRLRSRDAGSPSRDEAEDAG